MSGFSVQITTGVTRHMRLNVCAYEWGIRGDLIESCALSCALKSRYAPNPAVGWIVKVARGLSSEMSCGRLKRRRGGVVPTTSQQVARSSKWREATCMCYTSLNPIERCWTLGCDWVTVWSEIHFVRHVNVVHLIDSVYVEHVLDRNWNKDVGVSCHRFQPACGCGLHAWFLQVKAVWMTVSCDLRCTCRWMTWSTERC